MTRIGLIVPCAALLLPEGALSSQRAQRPVQMACFGQAQEEVLHPDPRDPRRRVRRTGDALRERIRELEHRAARSARTPDRALALCLVAELKKRLGASDTESAYRAAIQADSLNPEYNWLFGDYLRSIRGPRQPLFPRAEAQYYAALRKLPPTSRACPEEPFFCFLHRSLVALYERDGLPLGRALDEGPPIVLLGSRIALERRTADIGEFDDVRDFTSEALFASSDLRLRRPLTPAELAGIARQKPAFAMLYQARFRLGALPTVDLLWERRKVDDAQVTNFYEPTHANRAEIRTYGAAAEYAFAIAPLFDAAVRGEVRHGSRQGLIEFLPSAREDLTAASIHGAVSRFMGADKVVLDLVWANDWITQQIDTPIGRRIRIWAPTLRYQRHNVASFERRIAPRGSEVYVGGAFTTEAFGSVDARRRDLFGGVALRGIAGLAHGQSFDATVQPTWFRSDRAGTEGDGRTAAPLEHSQLRTYATLLYRLRDHENEPDLRQLPPVVFLNLVLAASSDAVLDGPDDFLSHSLGAGLDTKVALPELNGGTTLLTSVRYDVQHYPHLRKSFGSFAVTLGVGF
jgi:hypothetical protein